LKSARSFPRAARLDGPHAYAAVFAYKCSAAGRYFRVYAKPGSGGPARLGIVVSTRVEARAVGRNASKRLTREAFRRRRAELPRLDFVVRVMSRIAKLETAQARDELHGLLDGVGRRCARRAATTE